MYRLRKLGSRARIFTSPVGAVGPPDEDQSLPEDFKWRTRCCPRPLIGGTWLSLEVAWNMAKKKCGQCPHSGLRTGSYIGRTGSDCLRFLEFPVFARAGMRFESHLGHSVFAGQKLFVSFLLTKLDFSDAFMANVPIACGCTE